MRRIVVGTILLCVALAGHGEGGASGEPPGKGRMTAFRYDANMSFSLLCRPGAPTDVQLGLDEKVVGFALGDSVQWVVEELPGHVFVKPLRAGLTTAGTLVTDRRTYQLALRSVSGDGLWHQRVSWSYPDLVVLRDPGRGVSDRGRGVYEPGREPVEADRGGQSRSVDPAQLNFAYEVTGDADVRPLQAFDDGRVTWLRMRQGKPLPALFVIGPDGPELVNYGVRSDHIMVQRTFETAVLKLGRLEARIVNRALAPIERSRPSGSAATERPPR